MASAFLRTPPQPALHKAVDTRRLSVTAALTYPVHDRAGDFVKPDGGEWSAHKADPWVGLEHYRFSKSRTEMLLPGEPGATEEVVRVGTAADPDTGRYSVVLKSLPEGNLPFGTTWFDPADRLSAQTFRLIEQGALEGVSLEFTLRKGMYRELGPSPLERRNAYHVDGWNGLGWVHCVTPVNPGAQILKAVGAAQDIVLRVAQTGRIGGEAAHPLILKSFARFLPGKSATVTGGFTPPVEMKAMDEPADMTAAYEKPAAADAGAAGGSTPTVQALYQLAQGLTDMKAQVEELLAGSEHVKGKKFAGKLLADLDETAADATEMAAKIEAELGAKDDAEPEPDTQPDDNEAGDDGVLKCIARRPAVFKAIGRFALRRFSKAEVAAAPVVDAAPAAPSTLEDQLAALQQSDPDAYARVARRAARKLTH